ncbi:hypothetical protein NDU88_006917 [Pleurodeles waltl]|uniref:Uncharacterized protein n=1 Tax=Pleurodeles waltl TaxID=8319 RepID=A0AAV7WER2_PLEWA|nr:hypothetical protein NDU88_006917 [Pleurodeles waltl]
MASKTDVPCRAPEGRDQVLWKCRSFSLCYPLRRLPRNSADSADSAEDCLFPRTLPTFEVDRLGGLTGRLPSLPARDCHGPRSPFQEISHVPSPASRLALSAGFGLTQVWVSASPEPLLRLQLESGRPPPISGSSSRGAARPPSPAQKEPLAKSRPPAVESFWSQPQADPSSGLRIAGANSPAAAREELPAICSSSSRRASREELPACRGEFGADLGPTQALVWLQLGLRRPLGLPLPPTPGAGAGQIAAQPEFHPVPCLGLQPARQPAVGLPLRISVPDPGRPQESGPLPDLCRRSLVHRAGPPWGPISLHWILEPTSFRLAPTWFLP